MLDGLKCIEKLLDLGLDPNANVELSCTNIQLRHAAAYLLSDDDSNWERYLAWLDRFCLINNYFEDHKEIWTQGMTLVKVFLNHGSDSYAWISLSLQSFYFYRSKEPPVRNRQHLEPLLGLLGLPASRRISHSDLIRRI